MAPDTDTDQHAPPVEASPHAAADAVLTRMDDALNVLTDARRDRARYVVHARDDGVRPSEIARHLQDRARALGFTPERIEAFGISESSVRLTLKLAAAREAGEDVDDEEV